jgi:hypothetical protein
MARFNGYPSFKHWNTALWLNNDEVLYSKLRAYAHCVRHELVTVEQAMPDLLAELGPMTPDYHYWQADTVADLLTEQARELMAADLVELQERAGC